MDERRVVGLRPWPFSEFAWWAPVRAERLAALRIGLAATMLVDVLTTYLPNLHDYFGPGGLGDRQLHASYYENYPWLWSLLQFADRPWVFDAAAGLWVIALVGMLLGLETRISVLTVWLLSVSFANLNPTIDNSGDLVKTITLLYLVLTPCGAAWSLDRYFGRQPPGPVYVDPWALRLLFVQMTMIYFCNGCYKLAGYQWREGMSLYYVLGDLTLARVSYAQFPQPVWLTKALTWTVLAWEISFPLWIWWRPSRVVALCFGALFHFGIWAAMEVGGFAPYMLCLYLPLIPWEKWVDRAAPAAVTQDT